jgi:hypothetical protein
VRPRISVQRKRADVMDHTNPLIGELLHCFSRIERVALLADTAAERKQKSGDETSVFGVNGGELAAKVCRETTHEHVRDFFQL